MRSLVAMMGLAAGGLASAWLVPGQWELIVLLGFVIGLLVCELDMRIERRQLLLQSSEAGLQPQTGANGDRVTAIGAVMLAVFGFALQTYADVTLWAPPSYVSFGYFACSVLVGVALHMLVNARRRAERRSPGWPEAKEVSG